MKQPYTILGIAMCNDLKKVDGISLSKWDEITSHAECYFACSKNRFVLVIPANMRYGAGIPLHFTILQTYKNSLSPYKHDYPKQIKYSNELVSDTFIFTVSQAYALTHLIQEKMYARFDV